MPRNAKKNQEKTSRTIISIASQAANPPPRPTVNGHHLGFHWGFHIGFLHPWVSAPLALGFPQPRLPGTWGFRNGVYREPIGHFLVLVNSLINYLLQLVN